MLTKPGSRWVRTTGWLLLTVALAIAAIALLRWGAGGYGTDSSQQGSGPARMRTHVHTRFAIPGMDCVMCAAGLQNRLRALPGVARAEVSYQDKMAEIEYDPGLIDAARLATIVEGEGFKVGVQVPAHSPAETRTSGTR